MKTNPFFDLPRGSCEDRQTIYILIRRSVFIKLDVAQTTPVVGGAFHLTMHTCMHMFEGIAYPSNAGVDKKFSGEYLSR